MAEVQTEPLRLELPDRVPTEEDRLVAVLMAAVAMAAACTAVAPSVARLLMAARS